VRNREQIEARIGLGEWLIRSIANDPDPRRDQAIAHLREQIETLRAELAAPMPDGKPVDQVIGLQTLTLRSQIGGQNG
jgi:hypothetical protein